VADIVLDASVLGALFLNEDDSEEIHRVVKSHNIYAPSFWRFEVSNAVWKRKELPFKIAQNIIKRIWRFPVTIRENEGLATESLSIARKYEITFYDSFYIAMARLNDLPLWTMDKMQALTASKVGVDLWGMKNL